MRIIHACPLKATIIFGDVECYKKELKKDCHFCSEVCEFWPQRKSCTSLNTVIYEFENIATLVPQTGVFLFLTCLPHKPYIL